MAGRPHLYCLGGHRAALPGGRDIAEEYPWGGKIRDISDVTLQIERIGRWSFGHLDGHELRVTPRALPRALFALGKTVPAVDRTVSAGFKRHLTFLPAVCTGCFVHLARPSPEPATTTRTTAKRHCPSRAHVP